MLLKNPVTAPGIDPGTVRLVAQRLNHYATPGPHTRVHTQKIKHAITYKPNIEAPQHTLCSHGKEISIKNFECVSVAFVIRQAKSLRPTISSFVSCLALQYFSTSSHRRHDLRKIVIEHKMCDVVFSKILSKTFLILKII